MIKKRDNYLNWDEYFIGICLLSAMRSKDPNTQVGACIVNSYNRIVGIGYNGLTRGFNDDDAPWERDGSPLETKYPFIVHAEINAILNSIRNLKDCRIYVSLFPCNNCCQAIIQAGIKEVLYLEDKYSDTDSVKASRIMFEKAGVVCTNLESISNKLKFLKEDKGCLNRR